eukprot:6214139-Pleurochrysis_carterae.AAC.2
MGDESAFVRAFVKVRQSPQKLLDIQRHGRVTTLKLTTCETCAASAFAFIVDYVKPGICANHIRAPSTVFARGFMLIKQILRYSYVKCGSTASSSQAIELLRSLLLLQGPHFGNTLKWSKLQITCSSTPAPRTQLAAVHSSNMLNGFLMSAMKGKLNDASPTDKLAVP